MLACPLPARYDRPYQAIVRWTYGAPPKGNANFAWVQHFVHHLAPNGRAGFVLANGSMSSNQSGEGEIRKNLIEKDLVECMVALPGQLFYSTQIPVCLWFLARKKPLHCAGKTLFIDARKLGRMIDRVHRELADDDIGRIAGTFHAWRSGKKYEDVAGFCKSAATAQIVEHGHVLTPGRYVGAAEVEEDDEPFEEKMQRLVGELNEQFKESRRLEIDNMIRFFRAYPEPATISQPAVAKLPTTPIVQQPAALLPGSLLWSVPWAHHVILMQKVKDLPTRRWYMEQTLAGGWSRNLLTIQIDAQAHARHGTAISNFAAVLPAPQSDLATQALKDPLSGIDKPIGVSSYQLTRALPASLKSALPTVEEIEAELATGEAGEAKGKRAARKAAKKKPANRKRPRSGEED
jgi:hypothetical protein